MEPKIKCPTKTRKIVATAASGKSSFTVEGVRVEHVLLPMGEEVLDPHVERWHGNTCLDVLDDEHAQLRSIVGTEIYSSALQNRVDGCLEAFRVYEGDEVADLIEPIGLAERLEFDRVQHPFGVIQVLFGGR